MQTHRGRPVNGRERPVTGKDDARRPKRFRAKQQKLPNTLGKLWVLASCVLGLLSVTAPAFAATLASPYGGASFSLPDGQVVCGDLLGGWTVDARGTKLRPPQDPSLVGKSTPIRVASSFAACSTSKDTDTLVVTGPIPQVDQRTADLWLDELHLDVRGTNLDGSRLEWEVEGEHGSDRCVAAAKPNGQQTCSFTINKTSAVDLVGVNLLILPAGAPRDARLFDDNGRVVEPASLQV